MACFFQRWKWEGVIILSLLIFLGLLKIKRKVMLLVQRIQSDHDRTPLTMRRALTYQQALSKHQCCGAFNHFCQLLKRMMPPADFDLAYKSLSTQFASGYLDPDLSHVLETTFPPGEAASVSAFRHVKLMC